MRTRPPHRATTSPAVALKCQNVCFCFSLASLRPCVKISQFLCVLRRLRVKIFVVPSVRMWSLFSVFSVSSAPSVLSFFAPPQKAMNPSIAPPAFATKALHATNPCCHFRASGTTATLLLPQSALCYSRRIHHTESDAPRFCAANDARSSTIKWRNKVARTIIIRSKPSARLNPFCSHLVQETKPNP